MRIKIGIWSSSVLCVIREVILIKILATAFIVCTALLASVFIEPPTQAPAAYVGGLSAPYDAEPLASREEGLDIKGELPVLPGTDSLSDTLNKDIQYTYRQKVASAKESKARSITFRSEYYSSQDGVSTILLRTTVTTAVSKEEVDSFNYIPAQSRMVGVNDILGANGLQIADKVISQQIRANPEKYYANFPGLQDTDAFYVSSDGAIVFLFDAFQIAPGSMGVVSFPMKRSGVISTMPLTKGNGYWISDTGYNLKMVSLRSVCGSLGYQVIWDREAKMITIKRTGDASVYIKIDENYYISVTPDAPNKLQKPRPLESPPVMKDGVTYVPISFFDQILELVAYHVDENDNIIFTTYLAN